MPVTQNKITENSLQSDGARYISFEYVFDNGDKISFNSIQRPGNYDVDAGLIEYAAIAEDSIIEREDSGLMAQVDNENPAIAMEPVHPSTETSTNRKRRLRRKLLRWIANEGDLKIIRKIFYPIWYWLKFESGYNAQQIANYLGISLTVLQKINDRFQALHDNLAFVDADDSYLGEVD